MNLKPITITPYKRQYQRQVEDLLFYSNYVHSQLDWQPIEEWLSQDQAIIRLGWDDQQLVALIGASQPLYGASWLRVVAVESLEYQHTALHMVWEDISAILRAQHAQTVSCLVLDEWLVNLFPLWGIAYHDEIITLQRHGHDIPPISYPIGLTLRPTESGDVDILTAIDQGSFTPPWQNQAQDIRLARRQAAISTLALMHDQPVGFQFSTIYQTGGHLARLAVLPEWQGYQIGGALISELITQLLRRNVRRLTVNTQASNTKSLRLYQKFGFIPNNLNMPVWTGHL